MAKSNSTDKKPRSPLITGLLSLVFPGAGQLFARQTYRAFAIVASVLITFLVALWYKVPGWYSVPAAIWLWNIWDAFGVAKGKPRSIFLPILFTLILSFGIGWQATNIDLSTLTKNLNRVEIILKPMLKPDFLSPVEIKNTAWAPVELPCGTNPPPATNNINGIQVDITPSCGKLNDPLILKASGLWPDSQTLIQWADNIGNRLPMGPGFITPLHVNSDKNGTLSVSINIPTSALDAAPDPTIPLEHRVYLVQTQRQPGVKLSANGKYIIDGMYQTIFLGLISTTLGALGAIPISFLAARNLMGGNPITLFIYFITRTILNIIRSIEPLIIAIIFVVIVGLGPFAGLIAISLHTIAALGKLYSEVIEGIDPGPIEAIRSTGATWIQVVRYAVIPQIVPPFTAFTIYRWDINVRTSTIIGFVGGGGIGFYLYQWIIKGDFRAVSSSFIAIAIVVMLLDFISAWIRKKLI